MHGLSSVSPFTRRLLLALLAGAVLAVVFWLLWPRLQPPEPARGSPTATVPVWSPSPVTHPTPPPHRLAGVAVGTRSSFAAFEGPDGRTALYQLGDEVPGLGTLTRIEERRAFVSTTSGEVEFRVRPAPTPTLDLRSPSPARVITVKNPSPLPARTAAGSPP